MKWVLIWFAINHYSVDITSGSAQFETKDLCEFAMDQIRKTAPVAIISAGCYLMSW